MVCRVADGVSPLRLVGNAGAFNAKRPCVRIETQGRYMENSFTFYMKRKDVFSGFLEKYRQRVAPVFTVMRAVGLETQLAGCLYVACPVVNEERF